MKTNPLLKNFHIKNVSSKKMYGYEGMNKDAAKAMGYPWPYDKNTIIINEAVRGRERSKTKIHEVVEKYYMDKGMPYWKAHKKATNAEKQVK